jgi:DNA-binding transcriptional ArsR family regulator
MSSERRQVLDLLAQGKITAEDAERLLDKLSRSTAGEGSSPGEAGPGEPAAPGGRVRFLRVVVNSEDGDKVNIRIPLSLVRAGIKLRAVMPEHARRKLEAKGVDLEHLSILEGDELVNALRELHVDVGSAQGETVRVFCCE